MTSSIPKTAALKTSAVTKVAVDALLAADEVSDLRNSATRRERDAKDLHWSEAAVGEPKERQGKTNERIDGFKAFRTKGC